MVLKNITWKALSFIIIGAGLFFITPYVSDAFTYTIAPGPVGCVKTFNASPQLGYQASVRFYNSCPDDLYINACVTYDNGETKLYQSGQRVLSNGNFTITTFPDVAPRLITWTAAPYNPSVPAGCLASTKGF